MNRFKVFLILVVIINCELISTLKIVNKKSTSQKCSEVPKQILSDVLGSAFNSRYMSMSAPPSGPEEFPDSNKRRATTGISPSFVLDESFAQDTGDQIAWPWSKGAQRKKRETKQPGQQWQCESKVHWVDLGPDYFPRYLRSIECVAKDCWYGRFKCKPRSFGVKLLRRKRDECMVAKMGTTFGMEGLPIDLRELWVWEERAVNFCCECSL